MKSVCNTVRSF